MKTVVEMNFACISISLANALGEGWVGGVCVCVGGGGGGMVHHVDQNIKISIKW